MRDDVGRRFAYRDRAHTPGDPVRPVALVKEGPPRSQKVKVRRLDGEYEGLEEWIPKVRLLAPWENVEGLIEDERSMLAAFEASGDVYGTATYRAVETVWLALPQEPNEEVFFGHKAIERELLVIEKLDGAATKLGLPVEELLTELYSYVDRFSVYKAPFGVAVEVAHHCCKRFAREVLRYVKQEEGDLRRQIVSGKPPSSGAWSLENDACRDQAEARLKKREAVFALIREWCGGNAVETFDQVSELRNEVDRLRVLAEDTARWLRDAGHPVKAAQLLRKLDQEPNPR